jgi:predicted outer membrane repeat protein
MEDIFMFIKAIAVVLSISMAIHSPIFAALPSTSSYVIGNGTPALCTDGELNNAISAANAASDGMRITFNCGSATARILIKSEKVVTNVAIIDGGSKIILDAQGRSRIFSTGNHSEIYLENITLTGGYTTGQGGAVLVGLSSNFTAINAYFIGNRADDPGSCYGGGAIRFTGLGYSKIDSSFFDSNSAKNGGAINSTGTSQTITNTVFNKNSAMHTDGTKENPCGGGGAIFIDGTYSNNGRQGYAKFTNNTFTSNFTNMNGGAIFAHLYYNEAVTISGSLFDQNNANFEIASGDPKSGSGGAIWLDGENQQSDKYFTAIVGITDSTFSNNHADYNGGGIYAWDAPVNLTNLTMDSNVAKNSFGVTTFAHGNGGGIAFGNTISKTMSTLTNVTLTKNTAGVLGGGIVTLGGTAANYIQLINTVVANNTAGNGNRTQQNCSGQYKDLGGNIQYPAKLSIPSDYNCTGSILIANPLTAALASNGGPLKTVALGENSPAIDHGVASACPPRDERSYLRSGVCDSGAYEFNGKEFIPTNWLYLPSMRD